MVRRDVYEHLGGFDRRIVCCGEDWEMWVRIAAHYPVGYEVEPLAVYRFKPLESLALARICQIMQDMRMASEIIQAYLPKHLPQTVANKLLNQARETYAFWALEPATQMLSKGNTVTGIDLIREALQCSHSFRVSKIIGRIILRAGISQIKQKVTTSLLSA